MSWLLEDPWPLLGCSALAFVLLCVAYYHTRQRGLLPALLGVLLLAGLLVAIEWAVVTPREEVERALAQGAGALEANDLAAVQACLAPEASALRNQAATLFDWMQVQHANIGGDLQVQIDDRATPHTAVARFTGRVSGKAARAGGSLPFEHMVRRMEVNLRREGDRWLITDYRDSGLTEKRHEGL